MLGSAGLVTAGGLGLIVALNQAVKATDLTLHPAKLPWSHKGMFSALDHARYVIFAQNLVKSDYPVTVECFNYHSELFLARVCSFLYKVSVSFMSFAFIFLQCK